MLGLHDYAFATSVSLIIWIVHAERTYVFLV